MYITHRDIAFTAATVLLLSAVCIGGNYTKNKLNKEIPSIVEKARAEERPRGVANWDLNSDGREDIVVYSQNATNIFIQRKAGGYTPFEKYKKDLRDMNDIENKKLEDSFENINSEAGRIRFLGAGR